MDTLYMLNTQISGGFSREASCLRQAADNSMKIWNGIPRLPLLDSQKRPAAKDLLAGFDFAAAKAALGSAEEASRKRLAYVLNSSSWDDEE